MPTLKMPASNFTEFMSRLLTFCEKPKKNSSGVNFMKIYECEGVLCGESTDRYRALIRKTEAASIDEGFQAFLKRDDVEEALKTITKQLSRHVIADEVSLDVDEDGIVELRTTLLSTGRENTIAFEKEERSWVRMRELIQTLEMRSEATFHLINTNFLKDLGINSGKSGSVPKVYLWQTNKPMILLFAGDDSEIGALFTFRIDREEKASRMKNYPIEWLEGEK